MKNEKWTCTSPFLLTGLMACMQTCKPFFRRRGAFDLHNVRECTRPYQYCARTVPVCHRVLYLGGLGNSESMINPSFFERTLSAAQFPTHHRSLERRYMLSADCTVAVIGAAAKERLWGCSPQWAQLRVVADCDKSAHPWLGPVHTQGRGETQILCVTVGVPAQDASKEKGYLIPSIHARPGTT